LDWRKDWNKQDARVLSSIFTEVQQSYGSMTKGEVLSVDTMNSRGSNYFRNKKYNSKPDIKEQIKKRKASRQGGRKTKSTKLNTTENPLSPSPVVMSDSFTEVPQPPAASSASSSLTTELPQLHATTTLTNSSLPTPNPTLASTPVTAVTPTPASSVTPTTAVVVAPTPASTVVGLSTPESGSSKEATYSAQLGDKVLVRGENLAKSTEYWPGIVSEIDLPNLKIVWLSKIGKSVKYYRLGKNDYILNTSVVGILPGITTSDSGNASKFEFSAETTAAIAQLTSSD